MEKIASLNKDIKEAGEKFLKADDNLDKSFWLGEVQRLTKRLEIEEQLRLKKAGIELQIPKKTKKEEQLRLQKAGKVEQLRLQKAEKEWLTGICSLIYINMV